MQNKERHSGVSEKDQESPSCINPDEYQKREVYTSQSTGANLIGRSDLDNQGSQDSPTEELIFEVLKRSPEIDVSHVTVKVEGNIVTLEGSAEDIKECRAMTKIVENIPCVKKVINNLSKKMAS